MTRDEIILWSSTALAPVLLTLVAGRTLRRIVLLPFQWLASRTRTKIDDTLIEDAKKDLGLD